MKNKHFNQIIILLKTTIPLFFFISMILFPKEIYQASLMGLQAWWNIVFPALFPFFVVSELFMQLGIVNFMGILLEPIMRPLFNLPGSGAFILAIGYSSGSPISAIYTSKLRKDLILSKEEAERLISFTNNASPLFMLSAIAVGMLKNPSFGVTIAGSHYLANLILGITIFRFWGLKKKKTKYNITKNNLIIKAYKELIKFQIQKNVTLGTMLKDAIKNSINNLLLIGGFIILFSTIIEILKIFGILIYLSHFIKNIYFFTTINLDTARSIASGIFEMTIGIKLLCETNASLYIKLISISLILGWAGTCIHAQVYTVINDTDIRFMPFIFARLLQGPLAALISITIFNPIEKVFNYWQPLIINNTLHTLIIYNLLTFMLILLLLTILSITLHYLK